MKKKIILTHKKTLIKSELPLLTKFSDASPGMIIHGFISKIDNYGCIVSFYNSVYGLVPLQELEKNDVNSIIPQKLYKIGQVVKCRIIKVNPTKEKLILSFKLTPEDTTKLFSNQIECGKPISGIITGITETEIIIETQDKIKGVISISHLSDFPSHCERIKNKFQVGSKIDEMLVLQTNVVKKMLILTLKKSLINASKNNLLPSSFDQLKKGTVIHGYIKGIAQHGCFVGKNFLWRNLISL